MRDTRLDNSTVKMTINNDVAQVLVKKEDRTDGRSATEKVHVATDYDVTMSNGYITDLCFLTNNTYTDQQNFDKVCIATTRNELPEDPSVDLEDLNIKRINIEYDITLQVDNALGRSRGATDMFAFNGDFISRPLVISYNNDFTRLEGEIYLTTNANVGSAYGVTVGSYTVDNFNRDIYVIVRRLDYHKSFTVKELINENKKYNDQINLVGGYIDVKGGVTA